MSKVDIFSIKENDLYREAIIDSCCSGLRNSTELKKVLNYVIDNKLQLLQGNKVFLSSLYDDDDSVADLILPSIRRLWGKIFLNPPQMLRGNSLELFQLSFDIDHFIDYLVEILPKVKDSLKHFDKLDRTAETLTLIVDNYIAYLFEKSRESEDFTKEIRDLKIKKMIEK
jgi:hypothetical protein